MRLRTLVALGLLLPFPAASALPGCVGGDPAQACLLVFPPGYVALTAATAQGTSGELSLAAGTGFYGDYVYLIGIVEQQGLLRVHGGVGATDRNYDGLYENFCACGAVQTLVYVPWGVGLEDQSGNGAPDTLYAEPNLGQPSVTLPVL
jgi:hypothetical protein